MSSDSFKNVSNKMRFEIMYLIYIYKKGLGLDNLQWLICHKPKPNQTCLKFLCIRYEYSI